MVAASLSLGNETMSVSESEPDSLDLGWGASLERGTGGGWGARSSPARPYSASGSNMSRWAQARVGLLASAAPTPPTRYALPQACRTCTRPQPPGSALIPTLALPTIDQL